MTQNSKDLIENGSKKNIGDALVCLECFSIADDGSGSENRTGLVWLKTICSMVGHCTLFTRPQSVLNQVPANCTVVKVSTRPYLKWLFLEKYKAFALFALIFSWLRHRAWLKDVLRAARSRGPFDFAIHGSQGNLLLGTELGRLNCPTIICGGGVDSAPSTFLPYLSFSDRIRDALLPIIKRRGPKNVKFAFPTNGNAKEWLETFGIRTAIIPDAIPTEIKQNRAPIPSIEPGILWYSNSAPRKGGLILESAWKLSRVSSFKLHTAGKFILNGEGIDNHGYLALDDLVNLTSQMMAIVVPSYREGFSTAAADALSLGIPVIAFDGVGGASIPGDHGFIKVSTKNDPVQELAKTFRDLEKGKFDLKKLRSDALRASYDFWGTPRTELIRDVFKKCLSHKSAED